MRLMKFLGSGLTKIKDRRGGKAGKYGVAFVEGVRGGKKGGVRDVDIRLGYLGGRVLNRRRVNHG